MQSRPFQQHEGHIKVGLGRGIQTELWWPSAVRISIQSRRDQPRIPMRFGSDDQCRAYLFEARWPEGFRCSACGHDRAWAHKARLIYECTACSRQYSLLAGTIFEQTKTGLAKWFSRHLPGHLEQGRDLGDGAATPDGLRQLSDRLELAA